MHTKCPGNQVRRQHLINRPEGKRVAIFQDQQIIRKALHEIQIMQRGHNCHPKPTHKAQHLKLVANVQMVGRLVQNDQPRFLRQGPRHHDALPLTARERAEGTGCEALQRKTLQCMFDNMRILRRGACQCAPMWRPAQRHDFAYSEGKISGLFLQDSRDPLRNRARGQKMDILPIQKDTAGLWSVVSVDHPQKR